MEECIFGHEIPDSMYRAYISYKGDRRCICMAHDAEVYHGRMKLPR